MHVSIIGELLDGEHFSFVFNDRNGVVLLGARVVSMFGTPMPVPVSLAANAVLAVPAGALQGKTRYPVQPAGAVPANFTG